MKEKNPLIGRQVVVNAGRYVDAIGEIIDLPKGLNAVKVLFQDGSKAIISRPDFDIIDLEVSRDEAYKTAKHIIDLQKIVDELKEVPQFAKYVKQKNLKLIDNRLAEIDKLLEKGILK